MNIVFQRILNLLPKEYRDKAYIAGGAAACFELADDIDVFVLGIITEQESAEFEKALHDMKVLGMTFRSDKPVLDKPHTDSCVNGHFNVRAEIPSAGVIQPIQFIGSPFTTIDELLQDFDISTHCWAVDVTGKSFSIPESTSMYRVPKLVHSNIPNITLVRYRKICLRYKLAPDPNELVKICVLPEPGK